MSDTPETNNLLADLLSELGTICKHNCPERLVVHARKLERERDEAITRRLETIMQCELYEQERDEAREAASRLHRRAQQAEAIIAKAGLVENRPQHAQGRSFGRALANYAAEQYRRERDEWAAMCGRYKQERDEARGKIENLKLQLGLWEDGNLISEETLGEIRLLNEQINGAFRERDEAREEVRKLKIILDMIKAESNV